MYTWKKQHGMVEQNLGYRVVHDLMQNFVRKIIMFSSTISFWLSYAFSKLEVIAEVINVSK